MFKKNNRYLIKSSTGFKNFDGIQKILTDVLYTFYFNDGTSISCSKNHKFLTDQGFVEAKNITKHNTITGKKISSIKIEKGSFEVFDPINVEEDESYITNDVISHNCLFLGSSNTLISGAKLQVLEASITPPKYYNEDGLFKVYEAPAKGYTYVIVVDTAQGQNLDYSAFSVFDVTQTPYRQVATYQNNNVSPLVFPTIIFTIAKRYNDAFVLIEINDVGIEVADILHYDLAYENLIKIQTKGKQGQMVASGFKNKIQMGLKTSTATKRIGCANLKSLIESDKLLLWDDDTIHELFSFTSKGSSFAAEEGKNDDLVMTLVNFAWLVSQKYFKEDINIDIRKILQEEQLNIMDRDIVPFGIVDNGLDQNRFVDDQGDVWVPVSDMHNW